MNVAKRLHAGVLLLVNNMESCYRPSCLQTENRTVPGRVFSSLCFLAASFFMLFLNWKAFPAKGCFTVPFTALAAGRSVSKLHIYIPLHCLWAQSSKEMHNAGRLMTWNGPRESILINWSMKDLPWKESPPEISQLLVYTLNTVRRQDIEWAVQTA